MVKSTLEKYELDIVNSTIENAIVITKSGLVFQCFGNKETVYSDVDLGVELKVDAIADALSLELIARNLEIGYRRWKR